MKPKPKELTQEELDAFVAKFWKAPDEALFTREEIAAVRRCSMAKLEREAWLQVGIPFLRDNGRALYCKRDVVGHLNSCRSQVA